MGSSPSAFVQSEMDRWQHPHSLRIDTELQTRQHMLLDKFKDKLFLCVYFSRCYAAGRNGVNHYFITDRATVFQFGSPIERSGYFREGIEILPDTYGTTNVPGEEAQVFTEVEFKKTDDVVKRMKEVCGARGNSLCLRNSEHVAKYVQCGSWISSGMFPGGYWYNVFQDYITDEIKLMCTQLPQELTAKHVIKPLFRDKPSLIKYEGSIKCLTEADAENAFNVVVVGPTGCGKSHFINMVYNKTVCISLPSANSVTRNIHMTRGTNNAIMRGQANRRVNIFDCLGFCDSELKGQDVFKVIKQTIEASVVHVHKVVIVCAGRLEKPQEEAIRQVMVWLDYKNYPTNFSLLYTKCDGMDQAQRAKSLAEVAARLELFPGQLIPDAANPTPGNLIRGGDLGSVNLVSLQQAIALPAHVSYEEIQDDLGRALDAVFLPSKRSIPLKVPATCMIL